MTLEQFVPLTLLALALAFLSETMVEYIFGELFQQIGNWKPYSWLLKYIAAAVGIGLAFRYGIDLLTLIPETPQTEVGIILSGLCIGRGANFIHQFIGKYLPQRQ